MGDDLFIRSLQGAGLVHDVDLFLTRFRTGTGRFRLAIAADAPDEVFSTEAMIPALRYFVEQGIGVLVLSGLFGSSANGVGSFAWRLAEIGVTRAPIRLGDDWDALDGIPDDVAIAAAFLPAPAEPDQLVARLGAVGCRKLVVLDAQGIVFRGESPESIVTIDPKRDAAAQLADVDRRQLPAATFAADIVAPADDAGLSVSLASPINLLAELFTVRGSGTLFRPPARFAHFRTPDPEREAALATAVERAFDRTLIDRNFASRTPSQVILESQGRAAAVLVPTPLGNYMSKFAVIREAQGTGLGAELWNEVCAATDAVFWRSRSGNPVNSWYARVADGMIREGGWAFFWRGMGFDEVEAARHFATRLPEDFVAAGG